VQHAAGLKGGMDTYLTEDEFCARYDIPPRTAQRWRAKGDGPPFVRLGPKQIRYRERDCEEWLVSRTFTRIVDEGRRIGRPRNTQR
jgi:predicted DNA-binding transcriptional regulator AlpA